VTRPRIATALLFAILCSACPDEEEKSLPPLTSTGAGSLPGGAGGDDRGADAGATVTATSTATGSGTGTEGDTEPRATESGTSDGTGTFGDDGTAGPETDSIGEPPGVTTGFLTEG
jgi:hypothetical protein